jgi:uncharacterized protein (DUF983 family)
MRSDNTAIMPCPHCGIDQTFAKLLLLLTRRRTCGGCGGQVRVRAYDLMIGVVRAGVFLLPITLFATWLTHAWWLLVVPAVWWAALVYLLAAGKPD